MIAETFLGFEIQEHKENLVNMFDQLPSFFSSVYSGFYCALCGAEYHTYFPLYNETNFKMKFSQGFCRHLIKGTISPLLYLYIHLPKLANLSAKMLNSCDFNGNYSFYDFVDEDIHFPINEDLIKSFENCKKSVNESNWALQCNFLCSEFNITNFSKFFDGYSETVINFTNWAHKKIEEKENDVKNRASFFDGDVTPINDITRILEADIDVDPLEFDVIFSSSITPSLVLKTFKGEFMNSDGLDLYSLGVSSNIDDETGSIANSLRDIKLKLESQGLIEDGSSSIMGSAVSENESSLNRLTLLVQFLVIFFFVN